MGATPRNERREGGHIGHYLFMQPLFYDGEERVLGLARVLPSDVLGARDVRRPPHWQAGSGSPRRVHDLLASEQFLRCRYVPTFQNGDPLPEFNCCRQPLASLHAAAKK
jgi:hypothetical protein